MQKLTKEQADWLINKVNTLANASSLNRYTIEAEIDKCTEKPFPDVKIDLGDNWAMKIRNADDEFFMETLYCGTTRAISVGLGIIQFKQFTEGCNKIVEWIDNE